MVQNKSKKEIILNKRTDYYPKKLGRILKIFEL